LTASRAISNATPMIRVVSGSNFWSPRNGVIGMIPIRSPCHSTKRERQSRIRQLHADNDPNSRLDQGEVYSRRAGMLLGPRPGLLMIRPAYYMTRTSRDAPAAFGARFRSGAHSSQPRKWRAFKIAIAAAYRRASLIQGVRLLTTK